MADESTGVRLRARFVGWGALAFVVVLLLMETPTDVPLHGDTIRDILIAREHAFGPNDSQLGATSSAWLHHGFAWHGLLSLWVRLGAEPLLLICGVACVYAVASLGVFVTIRDSAGPLPALVSVPLLELLTRLTLHRFDPLWNPTLASSGFALVIVSVWLTTRRGSGTKSPLWSGVPAVVYALVSQVHTELLLFFPALFAVPARGRGAWLARLLPIPALALAWWSISRDSLVMNVATVGALIRGERVGAPRGLDWNSPSLEPLGWLAVGALGGHIWARVRGRCDQHTQSFADFLAVAIGCYLLAYLPIAGVHGGASRYLHPLVAPSVVLLGILWSKQSERSPRATLGLAAFLAATAVVIALFGGPKRDHRVGLTTAEVSGLVATMSELGYSLHDSYYYATPAQAWYAEYFAGIWLEAPCQYNTPKMGLPSEPRDRVLILAIPSGASLPSGVAAAFDRRIDGKNRTFWLAKYVPYIRIDQPSVCLDAGTCKPFEFSFPNRGHGNSCWSRDWPLDALDIAPRSDGAIAMEFPISMPAHAEARIAYLPGLRVKDRVDDTCRGRIEHISGVDNEIHDGGATAVLRGREAPQRGLIRVSWPWTDRKCFPNGGLSFPLPLVEVPAGMFDPIRPYL